jgi:hypothetical protein
LGSTVGASCIAGFGGPNGEPSIGIADNVTAFTPTTQEVSFEVDNQPSSLVVFFP